MKIFKITTILFFALLAMSCNNAATNNPESNVSIELNNGQKWVVNTEMTPYILQAEQTVLQYDGVAYETLAKQLELKNKGLIKSCTMNGKSHDELHKWLHPHMQLINELDNAENKAEAEQLIAQVKSSFQTYHTYFQ